MLHLRDKEKKDTGSVLLLKCPLPTATARKKNMQGGICVLFSQSCDKHTLYLLRTLNLTFKSLEAGIMLMICLPLIVHFGSLNHWRPEIRTRHSAVVYKYTGHCLMMNKLVLQHLPVLQRSAKMEVCICTSRQTVVTTASLQRHVRAKRDFNSAAHIRRH